MWNYRNALACQRWLRSSSLKVPITLSSMVPAVSSNAWQRRRNLARQPWIPTIGRRKNNDSRCLWMVRNGRGSREEQNPTGGVTQNRRKSRRKKAKHSRVFKLRSPAFWLLFGGENGRGMTVAENRRYGRVTFAGRVGFLGRIDSFSLTLSHVHMFPCFQLIILLLLTS